MNNTTSYSNAHKKPPLVRSKGKQNLIQISGNANNCLTPTLGGFFGWWWWYLPRSTTIFATSNLVLVECRQRNSRKLPPSAFSFVFHWIKVNN